MVSCKTSHAVHVAVAVHVLAMCMSQPSLYPSLLTKDSKPLACAFFLNKGLCLCSTRQQRPNSEREEISRTVRVESCAQMACLYPSLMSAVLPSEGCMQGFSNFLSFAKARSQGWHAMCERYLSRVRHCTITKLYPDLVNCMGMAFVLVAELACQLKHQDMAELTTLLRQSVFSGKSSL